MPLSKEGKKTLRAMQREYGAEKGKQVFYAKMNKDSNFKSMSEKKNASYNKKVKK